jgi:hypothetical protein
MVKGEAGCRLPQALAIGWVMVKRDGVESRGVP